MKPLLGGLKLEPKKETTLIPWSSARASAPRRISLPIQNENDSFSACVEPGERVKRGQKIAVEKSGVALHASISGEVVTVNSVIEIISDGKDEALPDIGQKRRNWESLSNEEVAEILKDSGIDPRPPGPVKALILNACESEPYLTSDHSLLMSHPVEVLRGAEILRNLIGVEQVILAIEDNKEEVAEVLKSKIFFHHWSKTRVEILPALFPQELEPVLIRSLGFEISNSWVVPVWMIYAVYEAVASQKPFYERIVTLSGECVAQPRNFWIRIGTLAEDAVKYARGFLRKPAKVVLGGPMLGRAISDLRSPVLKDTRAILGLPPEVSRPETIEPCIRCNRCVESCPIDISPVMITLASEKGLFEVARDYGSEACVECGNCSYVCPAKRPMLELIQYANAQ